MDQTWRGWLTADDVLNMRSLADVHKPWSGNLPPEGLTQIKAPKVWRAHVLLLRKIEA